MIQIGNYFYLEIVIFFSLIFLVLNFWTSKRIRSFRPREIIRHLMWSGIIIFLGMILAGAKLSWEKPMPVKEKMEIIFALDASLSMLARDVSVKEGEFSRKISRLDMGKQQIENVVGGLSGDAIGIIVFADRAIPLQIILSREDYQNSLLRNLKQIDASFVRYGIKQGTDYGNLIMTALEQFSKKNGAKKALFVLTDGEPQGEEQKLQENLTKALSLFVGRNDIRIYLIGIGDSRERSKIPKTEDDYGNPKEYYTHKNGDPVITRPNLEFLSNLADVTGGYYTHTDSDQDLKNVLVNSIEKERRIIGFKPVSELIDLTPYLAICSLMFLITIPFLKSV